MLYKPVKVVVACAQREKLKAQIEQKYLPVKIDLKDTTPADTLLLTRAQIARIEKARELGRRKYKTIRMSRKQIEKNRNYQGGYLSLLTDEDPASDDTIASPAAASSDDGLYLIKQGHCMRVYPVQDNGLYLQEHSDNTLNGVFEDGLYLKRDNIIENAEGIVFAENSPFRNIPILGWIL